MLKNLKNKIRKNIQIFGLIFFQAEDGIRDFCLSRGLGDVYKRQVFKLESLIMAQNVRWRHA